MDLSQSLEAFMQSGGKILDLSQYLPQKPKQLPSQVYVRGDESVLRQAPKVAIVGTRSPSKRGHERAKKVAYELAQRGVLVVSGGAMGVDCAAHEGALLGGGKTLAILGENVKGEVDERPKRLLDLPFIENLCTITFFGPKMAHGKWAFVKRNEYVAAMCDAVLVIEGLEQSGTFYTAQFANRFQTPLWAVPGDPDEPLSQTPNRLISNGWARPYLKIEDLLESLKITKDQKSNYHNIEYPQHPVFDFLKSNKNEASLDEICVALKSAPQKIQNELFDFELDGYIEKKGASYRLVR